MLRLFAWIALIGVAAAILIPSLNNSDLRSRNENRVPSIATQTLYVNAGSLNVRDCPSTKCNVIKGLLRGQSVSVIAQRDGWANLQYPANGWVSSDYLTSVAPELDKKKESNTQPERVTVGLPATGSNASNDLALESQTRNDSSNAVENESGPDLWVKDDRAARHTCPNRKCGIVGLHYFREGVFVQERKRRWVRVTKYYDAACENGISQYVDKGAGQCNKRNGIDGGKFAEWVELKHLSELRPESPSANATGMSKIVGGSDDFRHYEGAFVAAANKLIQDRMCKESDFIEWGGWTKSVSIHRDSPVYFTYCEPGPIRYYLNAESGDIFR